MKKKLNPAWLYLIVTIALIPCCGMTLRFSNQLESVFLQFGIGIRGIIDKSFSTLQIGSFVFMKRHIPNLIYLSTMIYFVITLFRNKYNTNLFLAVCSVNLIEIFFSLLYNRAYYQFLTVLNILLYITITILTAIKVYSTKHLFKHLWIFPPLLKLIMFFWNCGNLSKPIFYHWSMAGCFLFLSRYPIYYIGIAVAVIDIIATALFSYNLVTETVPKKKKTQTIHTRINTSVEYNAYCGMAKHILLCIFTLGIWQCIWVWRTTKFLNQTPKAEQYNPTKKLLLCMFVPFYMIYWLYKHGQRIDAMYKDKNLGNSDMNTLCLILGIFIPIVAYIIMQDKINTLCTVETNEVNKDINENKDINFEDLNKLKDLLDSGIITQEEFEQKKKQLLGL